MLGTFESVKKTISRYCFIKGVDGKSYFCHQDNLKNKKHDWVYVWNGNECTFQIKENTDPGQKDIAVDVIPVPKKSPNLEKVRQDKIRQKEKQKRNIIEQIKKENKDKWDAHCKDHLYYTLTFKKKGSCKNEKFNNIVEPPTVYKDKLQAEENLYFHKAEKGDVYSYYLRRVVVYRVGGEFIVKELLPKNKLGSVIYKGRVRIYA